MASILQAARRVRETLIPTVVRQLRKELKGCSSVLDLACGSDSPLQFVKVPYSLGIDIFLPAIEESRKKGIHASYRQADVTVVQFEDSSFDAVMGFNILEHLSRDEGLKLIVKASRWARRKVIFCLPNGFLEQDAYDGNPFQVHLSSWSARDFQNLGFRVYGMHGWKLLRGRYGRLRLRPALFWLLVSDLTQVITYHTPELASTLFATKLRPE